MKTINDIFCANKEEAKKAFTELLRAKGIQELAEEMKTFNGAEWAVEEIKKHLKKEYPTEYNIYIEMGKYYLLRSPRKAIESFKEYIKKGGNNEEVMLLLAKLLKEMGNIGKAKKIIEKITTETAEVLREKVQLCGTKEKIEATEKLVDKGFAKETDIEEVLECYIQAGKENRLHEIINSFGEINNYTLEKINYYILKKSGKEYFGKLLTLIKKHYTAFNAELRNELLTELEKEKHTELLTETVEVLCRMIEADDTDDKIIQRLAILLRKETLNKKKTKIISLLKTMHTLSKKVRAANIFLNETEILERNTILSSKPRQLIVLMTTKCNLKCIMCQQNYTVRDYDIADFVINFIKENAKYLESIKWLGGEPLVHNKAMELMKICSQYGVHQSLITNGLLLTRPFIEYIVKNKIVLTVSIDAVEKDLYEKIRYGADFNVLIKNIQLLKELAHQDNHFVMVTVIMSLNYLHIEKFINFAILNGFKKIRFQKYMYNNDYLNLDLSEEQCNYVIERLSFFRKKYENKEIPVEIETDFYISDLNKRIGCAALPKEYYNQKKSIKCVDNIKPNEYNANIENTPIVKPANNLDKADDLFCIAPWTTLCFFEHNLIRMACMADTIKVNADAEIWNNEAVVDYRVKVVKGDYTICNKECYDLDSDRKTTRLGL
jgi:MoaA/NifB/PqqE/SkfB family radical SAM enzyme